VITVDRNSIPTGIIFRAQYRWHFFFLSSNTLRCSWGAMKLVWESRQASYEQRMNFLLMNRTEDIFIGRSLSRMRSEMTRDEPSRNSLTSRQVSGGVARAATSRVFVCIQREKCRVVLINCRAERRAHASCVFKAAFHVSSRQYGLLIRIPLSCIRHHYSIHKIRYCMAFILPLPLKFRGPFYLRTVLLTERWE